MSGYLSLEHYSPLLTLLVGLTGFFGIWGIGLWVWRRANLPEPWLSVIGAVTGILLFGLGCQAIAISGVATHVNLTAYLLTWSALGMIYWLRRARKLKELQQSLHPWMSLFLIPAGVLLMMAISGSTKIDEIYYHMLVPARIVAREELIFFQFPWQAAIPQMHYQIGLSPFHSIGFPHAGNVISWMLAMVFAFFAWSMVRKRNQSPFLAGAVTFVLLVGMYPMVWYVTSGAHSLGDLSVATAVIAIACYSRMPDGVAAWVWTGAVSTLLVAAAVTKVTLLPLTITLWVCHLVRAEVLRNAMSDKTVLLAAAVAPWLLFYLPMIVWTWIQSGSPFGPLLAGRFGSSIYSVNAIRTALEGSQQANRQFHGLLPLIGYPYSLLFWGLLTGFAVSRRIPRMIPALALGIQAALICVVLPWDLRFLGGTQLAPIILAGMYFPQGRTNLFITRNSVKVAMVACCVPWFFAQLYYVAPFVSFVAGLTNQTAFYDRYIAFHRDFRQLDKILPANAMVLSAGVRPPSIYFPREVYVRRQDVAAGGPVYLFACDINPKRLTRRVPHVYELGELVYENPDALISASRVPGVPGKQGSLQVFRLLNIQAEPSL